MLLLSRRIENGVLKKYTLQITNSIRHTVNRLYTPHRSHPVKNLKIQKEFEKEKKNPQKVYEKSYTHNSMSSTTTTFTKRQMTIYRVNGLVV